MYCSGRLLVALPLFLPPRQGEQLRAAGYTTVVDGGTLGNAIAMLREGG